MNVSFTRQAAQAGIKTGMTAARSLKQTQVIIFGGYCLDWREKDLPRRYPILFFPLSLAYVRGCEKL